MSHRIKTGDRVELHPATDDWMRGDRYGTVVGFGRSTPYRDKTTGETGHAIPVKVKLDKSGKTKRYHAENLIPTGEPTHKQREDARRKPWGESFVKPYHIAKWEERDRLHIALLDANDETIIEWWDDDARGAIEDGFLDRRNLLGSAVEYAQHMGVLPGKKL